MENKELAKAATVREIRTVQRDFQNPISAKIAQVQYVHKMHLLTFLKNVDFNLNRMVINGFEKKCSAGSI